LPMQAHNPTPKIMYPLSTYNYGNPGHYYDPLQFPVSVSSQMESPCGYCEVPPSQLYVLQPRYIHIRCHPLLMGWWYLQSTSQMWNLFLTISLMWIRLHLAQNKNITMQL
jgi:hypothetical protein